MTSQSEFKKNNNADVKKFCEVNFDINFPLTAITEVKGKNAHKIFKWAKENTEIQLFPNGIFTKF